MEMIDRNSLFVIIGDVKDQASIKIVTPLVRAMIPFWKAPSRKSLEQNKILFLLDQSSGESVSKKIMAKNDDSSKAVNDEISKFDGKFWPKIC